ncbi:formin-like protein 14 [Lemur catta]|uniref:formin-like protein 14 n=1 Tax=Lemur catta TaxID=9447 RepID=UPI001E26D62D|nr:formin-like protein 14 [Lemur catta]
MGQKRHQDPGGAAGHAPDRTGFLPQIHSPGPPAPARTPPLPTRCHSAPRAAVVPPGLKRRRSFRQPPTRAGPCRPGQVPTLAATSRITPLPQESRAAGTYLRPLVTREEPPLEAAQPPVLQPRGPNGTRRAQLQNGLAAPSVPRPPPVARCPSPSSARTSGSAPRPASPLSRLPVAPSPRGDGAAVLRCLQPPLPAASPPPQGCLKLGRVPGCSLFSLAGGCPRLWEADAILPDEAVALEGAQATGRGAVPGGATRGESLPVKPTRNKMDQKPATAAWGTETTAPHPTTGEGGTGTSAPRSRLLAVGQRRGRSQGLQPKRA